MRHIVVCLWVALVLFRADNARAQDATSQPAGSPWMLMFDGVVFATYSHQTGPRGGEEFISTDWLMGIGMRQAGPGVLTLTTMVSFDPATMGPRGYRELFQSGETYHFIPITDHQHPHDFLMQASASWRLPLTDKTNITFSGAPVGEAALGPVAFMHRASAAENPVAPLSHHTLDSTHIVMGVITLGVDRGPWTVESSVFNSAEPDDNRWDLVDFGPLDSWSARVTYKASPSWELQGSHGFLKNPEPLEFASVHRTTASASYFRPASNGFTAATFAYGQNDKEFHGLFHAGLAEATLRRGRFSVYGRLESVQVETELLKTQGQFHSHGLIQKDPVTPATIGGVIDAPSWRLLHGFELGVGAEVILYGEPEALRPEYGDRPVAFRAFARLRLPAGAMGRMWNMRMGAPMRH